MPEALFNEDIPNWMVASQPEPLLGYKKKECWMLDGFGAYSAENKGLGPLRMRR